MMKLWPPSWVRLHPAVRSFKASSGSTVHGIKSSVRSKSSLQATAVEKEGKYRRDSPCLMVPAGFLVAEGEEQVSFVKLTTTQMEEKEEEEEEEENSSTSNDDDYYDLLSVEGNKLVLKEKMKKKKIWLPWQREILSPDDAICIGSSHGWLAYIHPRNCSIYLYNPLFNTTFPYLPLPPIETLPSVISSLRRNIYNSSTITTEYTVPQKISAVSSEHLSQYFFKKIAFSSSPSSGDCTVMAIQGYRTRLGYQSPQLAFCRIGDASWTTIPEGDDVYRYRELVYLRENQLFYTYTPGALEVWDLRNPASPKTSLITESSPPIMTCVNKVVQCYCATSYLAESSGDLLMVQRYGSWAVRGKSTVAFDVYKLDFVRKKWVNVPSLGGDRVLFVGNNHCQSLSAHDFPPGTLIPNSIYFTDEPVEEHYRCNADLVFLCNDLGFFNLEDKSIYRLHLKKKKKKKKGEVQPSATWIVPQL